MKSLLTIGGCQIPVTNDISKNLIEIKKAIDWASDNNVNILGTPECALSGYMWYPENSDDQRVSDIVNTLEEIKQYSKLKNVDIILGTAFYNDNNKWANTQKFIVEGHVVHTHYKTVVFEDFYEPGTGSYSIDYKGIKIAGLICNDYWANPFKWPDATGQLVKSLFEQKTQIVFVSANVPKHISEDLFYRWHNMCVEFFSKMGDWITVVCDSPYLMNGEPYDGWTGVQSGIVGPRHRTVKSREYGTDYYKFTIDFSYYRH